MTLTELLLGEAKKDSFGYPLYSKEQVLQNIRDGKWETYSDVTPGKHLEVKVYPSKKTITIAVDREELKESLPLSNKAKVFSDKIKQSKDKEALQKELDSMFKAKEITASEFDELSADIGRLKVNESEEEYKTHPDEDIIIRLLEEAVMKIEKAEDRAVKTYGKDNKLSDELIPLMNKLEDEIMFISKGEYHD